MREPCLEARVLRGLSRGGRRETEERVPRTSRFEDRVREREARDDGVRPCLGERLGLRVGIRGSRNDLHARVDLGRRDDDRRTHCGRVRDDELHRRHARRAAARVLRLERLLSAANEGKYQHRRRSSHRAGGTRANSGAWVRTAPGPLRSSRPDRTTHARRRHRGVIERGSAPNDGRISMRPILHPRRHDHCEWPRRHDPTCLAVLRPERLDEALPPLRGWSRGGGLRTPPTFAPALRASRRTQAVNEW